MWAQRIRSDQEPRRGPGGTGPRGEGLAWIPSFLEVATAEVP